MQSIQTVLLGLLTGVVSGFFGVGGGVFLIPALVLLYGMPQQRAQGTSLAMLLLPVGLPGFLQYYKDGNVDLELAGYLIVGFVFGIWLSSGLVAKIDPNRLRQAFGVFLLLVSLKMIAGK
ncbi:MAG: sulfite exporter TauE/SafE family protein [Candidatus Wallbacteria bacterium]|nr:sulfite exporter TauE/SafE family protein [Candidatus Wallbacteria bacterium]